MDRWLMKRKRFVGELKLHDHLVPVRFAVAISNKGISKIVFDRMARDESIKFILDAFDEQEKFQRVIEFTLIGKARDGSEFHSTRISFNSIGGLHFGTDIEPRPTSLECSIVMPARAGASEGIIAHIRGRAFFPTVSADSRLGTVVMHGTLNARQSEKEVISGSLAIQVPPSNLEFTQWRTEVEKLFKHVRAVMSFARGARIAVPVTETTMDGRTELTVVECLNLKGHGMEPFTIFDHDRIFRQAVASHFFEGERAKKIGIAIEWFTMPSSYLEAQLTSAMTVLENLLTTNLSKAEQFFRKEKHFDTNLRGPLVEKAREQLTGLCSSTDEIEDEVIDIRAKLNELNRKPLKTKIYLLCDRWNVPLDDISDEAISAAKTARDHIVHRGQYLPSTNDDLLMHVRLIRELVIRLVLAALEYEGTYRSPINFGSQRKFKRTVAEPVPFR